MALTEGDIIKMAIGSIQKWIQNTRPHAVIYDNVDLFPLQRMAPGQNPVVWPWIQRQEEFVLLSVMSEATKESALEATTTRPSLQSPGSTIKPLVVYSQQLPRVGRPTWNWITLQPPMEITP